MIAHVGIEIRRRDADDCLFFWWLLGFERVGTPPALAERALWVQAGETQVHLLFSDAPTIAPEGHVAVVVADYEATLATLRGAGFEVLERARHWGSPRSFATSPGGHRVELMAFAPSRG